MALWEDKNGQIAVNDTAKETGTLSQVAPGRLDQTSLKYSTQTPCEFTSYKDWVSYQPVRAIATVNHSHHRPEMALQVEHSVHNPLQVIVSTVGT